MCVFGAEVYRKSTGVLDLGKSSGKQHASSDLMYDAFRPRAQPPAALRTKLHNLSNDGGPRPSSKASLSTAKAQTLPKN